MIIGIILFGWLYYSTPSTDELQKQKRYQDSLALLETKLTPPDTVQQKVNDTTLVASAEPDSAALAKQDSLVRANKAETFGSFAGSTEGKEEFLTIENDFMVLTLSTRGGRITDVQLKEYLTWKKTPLHLFTKDSSYFGLELVTDKSQFNTNDLYFTPSGPSFKVTGNESKSFSMTLQAGEGKHLRYTYTLKGNDHLLGFDIQLKGMETVIPKNQGLIDLHWKQATPWLEKDLKTQKQYTTVYFKYPEEKSDYLSESSDDSLSLGAPAEWVAFKQQFFSSILVPASPFDKQGAFVSSYSGIDSAGVKKLSAVLPIAYKHQPIEDFKMQFYFGPNHHKLLESYEKGFESVIPLGWGIFGWVNEFLVIPIFNFFDGFGWNYGLIILLLTIILKILLFPIAYRTYLSSAKMRVLRPELSEITKKFEGKSPMEKQQAQMALYKKAGVNPLSGCIPVLLQLPILFALVKFFPASIELRQQGFLWADDLSTYDSVWDFGVIPVIHTVYGDHMSLFAILMTVSTLLYTYSNSQLMGQNEQMPGMKYMIYIMPVMFLPFMNNFSAGLSYYYFLANMITFGQTWAMRFVVDEKKLHARIEENKKKPVKQSKWQKRLEDMQRQRPGSTRKK
ncbi:MAG: membrane protein insertase YidC [Bacteroidia bacterium]|nr:membrane protein insertase YidC [Bacteroidia bacterium]